MGLHTYKHIRIRLSVFSFSSVCLSFSPSIYLLIYLPSHLSIYLSACPLISIDLLISLPFSTYLLPHLYLSIYLSTYPSTYLPNYLLTYLSTHLSTYLPSYQSINLPTTTHLSINRPLSNENDKVTEVFLTFMISENDFRNVQMEETVISRRKGNFSVCIVLLLCVNYGCVCKYVSKRRCSFCY